MANSEAIKHSCLNLAVQTIVGCENTVDKTENEIATGVEVCYHKYIKLLTENTDEKSKKKEK